MKIAVIGDGFIGQQHIRAIQKSDQCTLDFIVDPSLESIEFCRNLNLSHFSEIEKALADRKPDGAIIATPNSLLLRHSLVFIENNIPLLVEKPISSDFKSALLIVQYAQKDNVLLMTGHHRRHNKIVAIAKKLTLAN